MRFLWISFGISMVLVIVDDKNGKNAWTVVASVIAFTLLLVGAFLFRFLPWEGRMIDQALKPIPTEGQIYDEFKRRAGRPPTPAEIAVIQNKIRNEKLTAAAAVIAALGGFALGAHLSKGGKVADPPRRVGTETAFRPVESYGTNISNFDSTTKTEAG